MRFLGVRVDEGGVAASTLAVGETDASVSAA
jgi:hypothetical protein